MIFRTVLPIDPADKKISYHTPVAFLGSCFAGEIGSRMESGKMNVLINPSGTTYNPVSIGNTIADIVTNRKFTADDIRKGNNGYFSFSHYTSFTSADPEKTITLINDSATKARRFLENAEFLFITFGTARTYRFMETGQVVSNCHKLPDNLFSKELLGVSEIVALWNKILDDLLLFNNKLKVIFTVSPVRHWKDGAHGNQVSKSVLFLAIEELMSHRAVFSYFPAYEILMDDLRDYRFYAADMLHPSGEAINYIWDNFSATYFDPDALAVWREINRISVAMNHRIISASSESSGEFASVMLKKINSLSVRFPGIDFSAEMNHFQNILEGS